VSNKKKNRGAVSATFTGIVNGLRKKEKIPLLPPDHRMDGVNILITGADSGLGLATATDLATRGCRVFMGVRRDDDAARLRIIRESGNDQVHRLPLDLSSLASVHGFLKRVADEDLTFHGVILNAAVVTAFARQTVDGLDEMLQVNFLSNVVLIEGLLQAGRIAPAPTGTRPRIVVVNSEAHRWTESIDLENFGVFRAFPMSKVLAHYSDTKFLMAGYVGCLTRRLGSSSGNPDVSVFALCPGAINSGLARNAPGIFKPLLKMVFSLFFASPKKAARPVVYLAASPAVEGKTGVYLHMRTLKEIDSRALDPTFGDALTVAVRTLLEGISQVGGEGGGQNLP
jgi:NAD(P)-dependent dehydrogenase (short-subunit alcohol dehydrogenase family)